MLVLLDENLPHRRRLLLTGHEVRTVAYQGWVGLTNGALLQAAEEAGFHVMVTADRNLPYQQNLTGRKLALVVLSGKRLQVISANISKILAAIGSAQPGSFVFVEIGH